MEPEEYQRLYELEDHLWWFVGMQALSLTLLDRFLPSREGLQILDAGCGTGGMMRALARYGHVVGIDLMSEAIAHARKRALPFLARGSVVALPFRDESFDLVTSFDVIYHRQVTDDEAALGEARRVLKPGGWLLLRAPAYDWLRSRHDRAVHTRHRYAKGELLTKLQEADLQPVYVSYANCFLFPLVWARRTSERFSRQESTSSDVEDVSPWLNGPLTAILRLEARILKSASLPWGLSLVAVARKP